LCTAQVYLTPPPSASLAPTGVPLDGTPDTTHHEDTERLFLDERVRRFSGFERAGRRKLMMIHAANRLDDLRIPPGNRLEALKGDRKGQHSIRIDRQWRVCFRWRDGAAWDVEIVDYHS
jgi:proteic killer suppression protein